MKSMRSSTFVALVLLSGACATAGDGGAITIGTGVVTEPTAAVAPATVRMQYSWIPDCQFAGYLMAQEQGFYAEESIEFEGLPGGPEVNPVQQVVTGAADFTVNKVAALFAARDQGLPMVAVAQFDQRSSFPLVAFKDTGIEGPEDLEGKNVGIWFDGDEFEVLALLAQFGMDPETDLTLFEQGFTMDPFLNREYDVAMVTSFNELNVLYLEGVSPDDLVVINPSDHGISIPHGTLMVNEEWLAANRDAAARFLRATLNGWRYAFDNPEETAGICAETSLAAGGEAATEDLQELQTRMIAAMEELHLPEGSNQDEHGQIDPALYESVAEIVEEHGLVEEPVDVPASYDPAIWEAAAAS